MSRRPNVILCTCDQLRAFEVGCYGNGVIRTPNLDRLASEGVRFEIAVTNFPVCMAARSVLLSGQYNRTCTGGVGNVASRMPGGRTWFPQYPEHGRPHLKDKTLPEVLHENGYHTATIGKWHIHTWPHDVAFDYYLIPRMNHCHTGQSFTENGGIEFVPEGYSVDFEADRLEKFLRGRAGEADPFFMYYNISPPHCPLADAPEKYLKMYDPAEVPIRPNANPDERLRDQDHAFKVYRWDFRYYNHRLPETMELPEGYGLRNVIAEYYGLTTWVDDTMGRMLRVLDEVGLAESTIVIFTSDHGDNLGSHGLVQKGQPLEESMRVPLLLRGPGLEKRDYVVTEQVAGLVDVMPTVLSLVGLPCPEHVHGRDMAPVIRGQRDSLDEPHAIIEVGRGAAIRTPTHMCSVPLRTEDRKLGGRPNQLYDLVSDPYELRNLAGDEAYNAVAQGLVARLREWDAATPWMEDDSEP
jgi:arylsulfatase A-like enzyme